MPRTPAAANAATMPETEPAVSPILQMLRELPRAPEEGRCITLLYRRWTLKIVPRLAEERDRGHFQLLLALDIMEIYQMGKSPTKRAGHFLTNISRITAPGGKIKRKSSLMG